MSVAGSEPAPTLPAPAPASRPGDPGYRPPFPKRLIVAALLLVGLAGLTALFALVAGYAAALSYAPVSPIIGLAGPGAGLMLISAVLLLARHRWAPTLTAFSVLYGSLLGFAGGAAGLIVMVPFLIVGLIVALVDNGVFGTGPMLPQTRFGRATLAGVAVLAVVNAIPLLTTDPLRPGDTRTPAWAGVIASAERRELSDGRLFGQPTEFIEGQAADGNLILAGGSLEAPSWAMALAPKESGCYMTRDMGLDDGPTVVMRIYRSSGASIGVRVTKAANFVSDPIFNGRYVGAVSRLWDVRLSAAGGPTGPAFGDVWTPAPIGYFCLNSNGQVAIWDRGYSAPGRTTTCDECQVSVDQQTWPYVLEGTGG